MKALDEHHLTYEQLIKPDEGHGFQNAKNREEFYTKLIAFLDRNIGAGVATPPADEKGAPATDSSSH